MRPVELLRFASAFAAHAGRATLFAGRTVHRTVTGLPPAEEILDQCVRIGAGSLPVLLVVSVFIGLEVAVEGYATFLRFGGENMLPVFAGMAEVRELCPAIAAAVLAAKAGTDIASSIGVMRIKEQLDALEVMAVDPYRFVVAPRCLAAMLTTPCLILFADAAALGASWAISVGLFQLDPGSYRSALLAFLSFSDILFGLIKGVVFGLIIGWLSCYFGFHASHGAEGVGRATNRAVVWSATLTIIANLAMTDLMYG